MSDPRLEELCKQMSTCQSCDLYRGRKSVVFGAGNNKPLIMVIGEAPGEQEDQQGLPFVGPAGEKLNKMLAYAGVSRDDIYITNAILCRPQNNREPRQEELEACHWRLDLQIGILKPQLIVVLGKTALQQLQGGPVKGSLRQYFKEDWMKYKVGNHECNVIVSYHPSFHLRSPEKAYRETLPHWTKIKQFVSEQKVPHESA